MDDFLMWAGGIILTGIFSLVGWAWKQHGKDIQMILNHINSSGIKYDDLEKRLEAHRLYAAETFSTKIDVEKGFNKIMDGLEKIYDKLDGKADKVR